MKNIYEKENEIISLVEMFQARTLPKEEWTHEAHLVVGLWHCINFGVDEALIRMRSGIISYNLAVGTENTTVGGYHETLTQFWLWAIQMFLATTNPQKNIVDLCQEFLQSPYADHTLALKYYSRKRLFSVTARAKFVEPDLRVCFGFSF